MTTEVSTEVNNLLTAEESLWQDAQLYWEGAKRNFQALSITLATLRKRYSSDNDFGAQCSKHLPDMQVNARAKLIQVGANIIARGNDVPAAEIFSLSLDALTEFSKAPIEQQHQIEADVKAGKKVTAKKIKEDNGTAKPVKQSDREKELEAHLAAMNAKYAEAMENISTMDVEINELHEQLNQPTSGSAFDKLKEELRQAKAETAKAKAEAEQARKASSGSSAPEFSLWANVPYERSVKALKLMQQLTHPDKAKDPSNPSQERLDAHAIVSDLIKGLDLAKQRYDMSPDWRK